MRLQFVFPRERHYDSATVREQACGGTEKAVTFLGEALTKRGHEVRNVSELGTHVETGWPDAVITQEAEVLAKYPDVVKRIWWCHHFADQPVIQRGAMYARAHADRVITLSQCHQGDLLESLKIDSTIIGHGVWLDELCNAPDAPEKDPYRLIYASTPFRGLERIPELFKEIKAQEPRATIAICSSMGTYGIPEQDREYEHVFKELATIDGVELKGALNQKQLYAEYARASIFCYPCTWRETYCLAMDEAIAHGCRPYTSGLGALKERSKLLISNDWSIQECNASEEIYGEAYTPKDWSEVAKQWDEEVL